MEEAFGGLGLGERDKREVVVGGRVLTARRLGSVLFLSVDNVSSFTLFSPETINEGISPPARDIFDQFHANKTGTILEISQHSVLQVVLTKEDFKGEIRDNNGEIEVNESLKELSRTIAMSHTVDIIGQVERNNLGQVRVGCTWLKIVARDRGSPSHKMMSKQDRDFQGHVPLCHFF